jgi:hypothetical protein
MERQVQASGCFVYLERLVANAGHPQDAIEVMFLQQVTMAHIRALQVQSEAASAQSLEAIQVLNRAAALLVAEFRQTALALQTYRKNCQSLSRAKAKRAKTEGTSACAGGSDTVQSNPGVTSPCSKNSRPK